MLSRCLRARKIHRCQVRPSVIGIRRYSYGHDDHDHHHVAVDLSHLERPPVNENTFIGYLSPDEKTLAPASKEEMMKNHGHLLNPENYPNADWTEQLFSDVSVLECIAEISASEYRLPQPLKAETVKAAYREQYVNFVLEKAPKMAKAGVSQVILHKLRDIYKVRSLVGLEEIRSVILNVSGMLFLGRQDPTWRVTFNGEDRDPLWKAFVPRLPGMGARLPALEFRSQDKYFGRHPDGNADAAAINIEIFKGARGFIKAVNRGLTKEERQKVKDIILRDPMDDHLDASAKAQVDGLIQELEALPEGSSRKNKMKEVWYSLGDRDKGIKKQYFLRQCLNRAIADQDTKKLFSDYKPSSDDVVVKEGEDYFTSLAAVNAKREDMKKDLVAQAAQLVEDAKKSGDQVKVDIANKVKSSVDTLVSDKVQGDLEIMHLLEHAPITERRLYEIAQIFAGANDPATDELLNDVINPHPIAAKLFNARVRALCIDTPIYTEEFSIGNETIWRREKDWPDHPHIHRMKWDELAAPLPKEDGFSSAIEETIHMKLFRLADSFLGLNLASDSGVLEFENFVHSYDVSPGESTLDRTTTSPAPHHTFAELPIIKFDGWEEADEIPEGVQIPARSSHH